VRFSTPWATVSETGTENWCSSTALLEGIPRVVHCLSDHSGWRASTSVAGFPSAPWKHQETRPVEGGCKSSMAKLITSAVVLVLALLPASSSLIVTRAV
jgi:hypothetical protein